MKEKHPRIQKFENCPYMYPQRFFQYESFMHFSYYYFLSKHSRGLSLLNSLVRVTSMTLKTQGICPWIVTQHPSLNLWKAYDLLAVEFMQTARTYKVRACSHKAMG